MHVVFVSVHPVMDVALFHCGGGQRAYHDPFRSSDVSSCAILFDENENAKISQNQCSRQTYPTLHITLFHWRLVCPISNVQEP